MTVPRFPRLALCSALLACSGGTAVRAQESNLALPGAAVILDAAQAQARNKVSFTGETSFTEDQLRAPQTEELREIAEKGVSPARADDLAFYVGSFYRKAGFSKVTVDYEIHGDKLQIKINEGPRSALRKIIFKGNKAVNDATLYEYMIGATPERLAKEPEQFPYTAAQIATGVDRVRGLYLADGYLNVAIDSSGVQLSPDGTRADVTVNITEGSRFTVGEIRFEGDTLFPRDKLIPALVEPVDGPFAPGKAEAMSHNLQSFYKAHGYYHAEVTGSADPTTAVGGKVPITFAVKTGPIFRFSFATVSNQTPTGARLHADFLPKRFASLHGQVYDPDKLDETFREMLRTGLFDNLRVALVPVANDELRMDLTATEAKARELGFTIGAGSYEGVSVGIRLGDRDLLGSGRPLTLSADYSQRGLKGELLYVDPWLLDSRFALRARIYSEARDEEGYSKTRIGARLDVTRKVMPHLELGVFIEDAHAKVTANGIDESLLGPLDYTIGSIGVTQNSDFRNDPINPARGFVFSSSFDYSTIEGQPGFTRSIGRFSYYLPLGRTLLAFGARAGYISEMADRIPIDVRFFNGGGSSVRSFAERELGPKDKSNNPLGGDFYTVFNVEYVFPLVGGLEGAAFIDAGSLRNGDLAGSGDMRYGVGLGLRYKLPIGPLRLDYGVNPDRRADEDFGAFNFSFGFAF